MASDKEKNEEPTETNWLKHPAALIGFASILLLLIVLIIFFALRSGEKQAASLFEGTEDISKVSVEDIPISGNASAPIAAGGYVWVSDTGDGTVSRINPKTGEVTATIPVGKNPTSTASNDKHLVVADTEENTLTFINTETGKVDDSIETGANPTIQELTDTEVTITTAEKETIVIDIENKETIFSFKAEERPTDLLRSGTKIWTTHPEEINIFDTETETSETIPIVDNPTQLIQVYGTVWIKGTNNITRVDAETLNVLDTKSFTTEINTITQVGDTVWAALTNSPQVVIFDSETLEPLETIIDCPSPTTPAETLTGVYITCSESNVVKQTPPVTPKNIVINTEGTIEALSANREYLWARKTDGSVTTVDMKTFKVVENGSQPPENFYRTETSDRYKESFYESRLLISPITDGTYSLGRGYVEEPLLSEKELGDFSPEEWPEYIVSSPGSSQLLQTDGLEDEIAIDSGIIFYSAPQFATLFPDQKYHLLAVRADTGASLASFRLHEPVWAVSNGYVWVSHGSSLVGRPYASLFAEENSTIETQITEVTPNAFGELSIGMNESQALETGLIEEFRDVECPFSGLDWAVADLKPPYYGSVLLEESKVKAFRIVDPTVATVPGKARIGMSVNNFTTRMEKEGYDVDISFLKVETFGEGDILVYDRNQDFVFSASFNPTTGQVTQIEVPSIPSCE